VSLILNIETATTVCSVSVADNEKILAFEEVNGGYTHAENLHVFIREMIKQAGITADKLNAIAVSKGPGSYTGLRIGVSAAKGLAYALNVPLISVDTLQVMAFGASRTRKTAGLYCPMIDARRMEVYTALYDSNLEALEAVNAFIVDENSIQKFNRAEEICFFGDGMSKCKGILELLPNARFIEDVVPSSENMAVLSYKKFTEKKFEDVAYFEPFYLKEFLITAKKKA
jgi:tRNA threonylcarbamoyladenosine biosynthesis protein TsaB